jgi:hypothetical protein
MKIKSSPIECQQLCQKNSTCLGFSYDMINQSCYQVNLNEVGFLFPNSVFKNVFLFIQFYEKVLSSMCSEILKVKTSAICINWFWKNYFEDLNSKYMLILCFKCFIQVLDLKRSFPNTDWVSGPKFCPSPAPTAISKLKLTWKKLYCDLYYLFLARLL